MTNRRGFLGALIAASLTPLAKRDSTPRVKPPIAPTPKTGGFGLAEIKREGEEVAYDYVQYSVGFIVRGSHPKNLWPGIKKAWDRHYKKEPKDWPEDLFDGS